MRYATFIQNTNRFLINQSKAGVSPSLGFIYQQLMFGQPGHSTVETGLDGNMIPSLYRIGVGKQQNVFSQYILFLRLAMQTGSRKALREETCSVHVFPKSFVIATARLPPRLSRIFNISTPGSTSATCASVVFIRA